jgi:Zn-dependent protease
VLSGCRSLLAKTNLLQLLVEKKGVWSNKAQRFLRKKRFNSFEIGSAKAVTSNFIYLATIWIIPVLIAITFHEAAHGFVARLLGDDTAWRLGRVSFNPLKHVDPVGTILLPGILLLLRSPFLFGYAKPVPVNFRALRSPRREE